MILDWWNAFVQWLNSADGRAIVTGTILPLLAILAAGIIAGMVVRGSTKRLMRHHDRQYAASAVSALVAAGRKAAVWSSLSPEEQAHYERLYSEADVRVRLLPVTGAAQAADWSAHEVGVMKKNSVSYSAQAEQDLIAYQDSLVSWHKRPRRAKKLFDEDLAAWKYNELGSADALAAKQEEWAAEQTAATAVPRTAASRTKK